MDTIVGKPECVNIVDTCFSDVPSTAPFEIARQTGLPQLHSPVFEPLLPPLVMANR